MRDGAYKLLLACSKREQVLNASRSLLTANARVRAYLAQLQKEKEKEQEEEGLMGATSRWVRRGTRSLGPGGPALAPCWLLKDMCLNHL